ncbi:hypothetical protein EMCRGX_G026098 [Ephydatia muelleri]|eukprot:Em0021g845a
MERTFKSQSQLPQRRWTLAGDAKPLTSNGRCKSAKSSTLPQIANRPITALPSYRTPSGDLAATRPERKAPFPRERPKSALVRPLSGRVSLRSAHFEWQANGSSGSRTSMLRLEDFSDEEDDCAEDEDKDTALQDLLTCSALNVEAKPHKPDWNVSDPVTPTFHCPRCRDHWYGLTPLPCDEMRAKLGTGGVWHRGQEDIAREEGRPKVLYRSKSARVRHTDEEKQNTHQPINGGKEPSKSDQTGPSGMGNPLKRESPLLKARRQIGFSATKDGTEQDSRATKSIVNDNDGGGVGDGGGDAEYEGDGTAHQTSVHDVTDKSASWSESPDKCDNGETAPSLEQTRLQGPPTNALPRGCNGAPPLNANVYKDITEVGHNMEEIFEGHKNNNTAPTDCFVLSEEKRQISVLNVPIGASISAPNDDSKSGHLRTKGVDKHDSVPPTNQAAPPNHTPLDHTTEVTPPPSEQYTFKNTTPTSLSTSTVPRPRSGRRSETVARPVDKRGQGGPMVASAGPLVPPRVAPIPPKRHTADLIYGFKLTSPWTFSYHAPASPPKKASVEYRSK